MKIIPLYTNYNFQNSQIKKSNSNAAVQNSITQPATPFYPKNYRPYFGARLNRTPENFFAQEFNIENMPVTVKTLLQTDFENNSQKRPMELQQEAFSWLSECTDIKDVMDMYPDEPLLQGLKTLATIRPSHGYLCDLRILGAQNNTVLKSGEDLTVYLLKKIYLEGKDLSEINKEFKNDVKEDFLDEEHYGEKGYFQYSTLASLGISFPQISYWHSLQATRLDKEYIPTTRTFDPTKERKPRIIKPRILTPEQKQKQSQRMIERWLKLSPTQQANQIAKMREGRLEKGSIFFDYLSQIMTIATEHIHLSDKLVEFFRKNATECPTDLSKLTREQHEKLQKFWDENPKLKEEFSQAITKTIKIYEKANSMGQSYIDRLNSIAATISQKNELNATKRKLTSDEAIKNYMRDSIMRTVGLYSKEYAEKYLSFVYNHKLYKTDFTRSYVRNIMENMDNKERYEGQMNKIMNTIHSEFVQKNMRETIAVNTAVAEVLYSITNDPLLFTANNTQLLISTILKNHLEQQMDMYNETIKQNIQAYTSGFSEEEFRTIYNQFVDIMKSVSVQGYLTLADNAVRERSENLPKILKRIEKDKFARNQFKNFIKQYEAQIKFSKKPSTRENVRYYIFESIIDDYLISHGL